MAQTNNLHSNAYLLETRYCVAVGRTRRWSRGYAASVVSLGAPSAQKHRAAGGKRHAETLTELFQNPDRPNAALG